MDMVQLVDYMGQLAHIRRYSIQFIWMVDGRFLQFEIFWVVEMDACIRTYVCTYVHCTYILYIHSYVCGLDIPVRLYIRTYVLTV